ncbi:MAG: hypothetical protein JXA10_04875 [Anaerolineae bacterium]|nr:hypothetical protein [Anaerolineae bacterium]
MRLRRWIIPLFVLCSLLSITHQVEAASLTMRGDRCEVAEDAILAEDFYFLCRILDVKGTIDGDLIGAAAEVIIHPSARITGDLWVGAGKLEIMGKIGDDIHFGGLTIRVEEGVIFTNTDVDLTSIALNTEIQASASLPGDLMVYGYQAKIMGAIGGDVDFGGEALLIDGVVRGRIDAEVGDPRRGTDVPNLPIYDISFEDPGLWIGEDAHISQNVSYRATAPSVIPLDVVRGTIRFDQTGGQPDITKVAQADDAAKIMLDYIRASFNDAITLLVLGIVGLRFVPRLIKRPARHVRQRTIPTIGWGVMTFILSIPVVVGVLLLGLLIVLVLYLLQLSELMLLIGIGVVILTLVMVGVSIFLLYFMGRVIVSFMIGELIERYVLHSYELDEFQQLVVTLALGVITYTLIANVPLPGVGLIVELITALAGAGAVVMYLRIQLDRMALLPARVSTLRPPTVTTTTVSFPKTALQPAREPLSLPPGLENLPEGFTGFDDDW